MIETLLPTAASAEMFADAPESAMFPVEAAVVARAVPERRREFGTVRYCAREALGKLGVPAVPILPDPDGAPRWPAGVVGSMTHCRGYRAAVVARARAMRSIGIDAELEAALPPVVHDLIVRDDERAQLRELADSHPDRHWDRILFCAKEAIFKAWFPLTRRWLEFLDVSATLNPDGTFWASLRASPATGIGAMFFGRWAVNDGLIIAATSIGQNADNATAHATPADDRSARDEYIGAHA